MDISVTTVSAQYNGESRDPEDRRILYPGFYPEVAEYGEGHIVRRSAPFAESRRVTRRRGQRGEREQVCFCSIAEVVYTSVDEIPSHSRTPEEILMARESEENFGEEITSSSHDEDEVEVDQFDGMSYVAQTPHDLYDDPRPMFMGHRRGRYASGR